MIGWLEDALAPLAERWATTVSVDRLAIAIRSAIGIESFVWLTDIAGLTTANTVATLRWSAQSMFDAPRGTFAARESFEHNRSTTARRTTSN